MKIYTALSGIVALADIISEIDHDEMNELKRQVNSWQQGYYHLKIELGLEKEKGAHAEQQIKELEEQVAKMTELHKIQVQEWQKQWFAELAIAASPNVVAMNERGEVLFNAAK